MQGGGDTEAFQRPVEIELGYENDSTYMRIEVYLVKIRIGKADGAESSSK